MILVFGQSGQVARELSALPDVRCLGRDDVDLEYPLNCAEAIAIHRPSAVINAAAYTNVDGAETDEARAHMVNAGAPEAMAQACAELGVPFVSISTDYVFDGSGNTSWTETDLPAPINAYGRTKLAGEQAIAETHAAWAVLRTSWVVSAHGSNFVKTMLRLGAERDALNVVADQIGGLTPARDIALACHHMAKTLISEPDKGGLYHFSGAPNASWADVARAVFEAGDLNCAVSDIPSTDYPTPAKRPLNSRLDCHKIAKAFGLKQPNWRHGIADIVSDIT